MNLDAEQLEGLADSLVESHDKLMEDLIAMRKRHRLTQEVIAERMGVSQPSVAAFERYDANPTLSSVRRYALAVGASIVHTVEDRCCAFDDQEVTAVLQTSLSLTRSLPWTTAPTNGWGRWADAKRTDYALAGGRHS